MNNNFILQDATKLTKSQMKNVKGGSMSYCDKLQAWANTYYKDDRISDSDWGRWADNWEKHCSK